MHSSDILTISIIILLLIPVLGPVTFALIQDFINKRKFRNNSKKILCDALIESYEVKLELLKNIKKLKEIEEEINSSLLLKDKEILLESVNLQFSIAEDSLIRIKDLIEKSENLLHETVRTEKDIKTVNRFLIKLRDKYNNA